MLLPMTHSNVTGALPDELATLWYLIRRIAGVMDRQGEALFRRELGIAHPGPLSQQAIADRVGLTKGSVSRQIDHAVAAGLMTVRVAPHTRRENAVALTETGTTLVRRGDALFQTSRDAMLAAVDRGELTSAVHVLSRLLGTLEA
jgi:DNA-binding MarR family transcriptional regulator